MDQYELGNEKTWPETGTLNYNTILQLGLFFNARENVQKSLTYKPS